MKALKLVIANIGLIEHESIELNQPLICFYGEIRQGKSTILNAVRWVCGGEFPQDIIRHGAKEGKIELHFDGGIITRSFYRAEKEVKARPVTFARDGKAVSSPVTEIKRLLNPFLLDQDFLVKKTELERKRFFTDLFGVDTSDLDKDLFNLEREASALRAEIKGYGEIDLTKHDKVDVGDLSKKRAEIVGAASAERQKLEVQLTEINDNYELQLQTYRDACTAVANHNSTFQRGLDTTVALAEEISELEKQLEAKRAKRAEVVQWLEDHPKQIEPVKPTPPDTTELKAKILALHTPDTAAIDKQISDAAAQNVRAEQFLKNLDRNREKADKTLELSAKELAIRKNREEKLARLKSINDKCPVAGLKFNDEGEFSYEDTDAGMLSTSQLMKLSSELSSLFPEGLGIELVDRGESLGKSIFEFVARAQNENKTILATVVGERPAEVPEHVGVFVVSNGKLSP